jgi:hypothetical protein
MDNRNKREKERQWEESERNKGKKNKWWGLKNKKCLGIRLMCRIIN